jgi:hypothetical protein
LIREQLQSITSTLRYVKNDATAMHAKAARENRREPGPSKADDARKPANRQQQGTASRTVLNEKN